MMPLSSLLGSGQFNFGGGMGPLQHLPFASPFGAQMPFQPVGGPVHSLLPGGGGGQPLFQAAGSPLQHLPFSDPRMTPQQMPFTGFGMGGFRPLSSMMSTY